MSRILVVDDDNAVRLSIKLMLEMEGHEIVLARDGRSGLAAFATGRFDVVICDIFMPDMDGFETIQAFHQRHPDTPVIAMSGFTFHGGQAPAPDFLNLSTKLGAACSLRKPFRPHELLEAVRSVVVAPPHADVVSAN